MKDVVGSDLCRRSQSHEDPIGRPRLWFSVVLIRNRNVLMREDGRRETRNVHSLAGLIAIRKPKLTPLLQVSAGTELN